MASVSYLHGFASGPESQKGRAYDAFFSERGHRVKRLDLRIPDRNRLRVSMMVDLVVREARSGVRPFIIGSSLGGLVAAHAAERAAEVIGCVLMAPAFGFARRWRDSLGADQLERWRGGEPLEVEDHGGGPPLKVDYGFYEDASAVDARLPSLRCPVLVFHGKHDDVVPIEHSRRIAEQLEDVELIELDDDHRLVASLDVMLPRALEHLRRCEDG